MKLAVIGSGIAGIASAVRMAIKGFEVDVYEANDYPGGKLSEFYLGEYRFDAGPSLFTMPHYVEELFAEAGKKVEDYFNYEKLEVICNYFWEDGDRLSAFADIDRFDQAVQDLFQTDKNVIHKILQDSRRKYELCGKIFLENSLHKLKTWTNMEALKGLMAGPSLDLFTSMHRVNEKQAQHPKLVQLFDRYATYNGSNPYLTPGLMSVIPHFEYNIGAFVPKQGMFSITASLKKLAEDLGVRFHFNQKVEEIIIKNKKVSGIKIKGERVACDFVISNMDIFNTYKKLLKGISPPKRILAQKKSTSALIFYWGVQRSFPALDVHNILFSQDYQNEFSLMESGKVSKDPTVYINISKKYKNTDAPEGCENWFVMINVPNNSGQDWEQLIPEIRHNSIQKINRMLNVNMEELILCESSLDPRSIESKTSSHLGALYGNSSDSKWAAFMRHSNFSKQIKNLYFCGGSVHPGGGIPLCLLSAKIIDDNIKLN